MHKVMRGLNQNGESVRTRIIDPGSGVSEDVENQVDYFVSISSTRMIID